MRTLILCVVALLIATQLQAQNKPRRVVEEQLNQTTNKWQQIFETNYFYTPDNELDSVIAYDGSSRIVGRDYIKDANGNDQPRYSHVDQKISATNYKLQSIWIDSFQQGFHTSQTQKKIKSGSEYVYTWAPTYYDFTHELTLGNEYYTFSSAGKVSDYNHTLYVYETDNNNAVIKTTSISWATIGAEPDTSAIEYYTRDQNNIIRSIDVQKFVNAKLARRYRFTNIEWQSLVKGSEPPLEWTLPVQSLIIENRFKNKEYIKQATLEKWDTTTNAWIPDHPVIRLVDDKGRLTEEIYDTTYRYLTYTDKGETAQRDTRYINGTDTTYGVGYRYEFTYNTDGTLASNYFYYRPAGPDSAFYPYNRTFYEYGLAGVTAKPKDQEILLTAYPSVTKGDLTLSLNAKVVANDATLKIYSPIGELLQSITPANNTLSIDLSAYPSGMYLIQLSAGAYQAQQKVIRVD